MTTTGQSYFTKKQTSRAHLWIMTNYALYRALNRMTTQGYFIQGTKHGEKLHYRLSKQAEDIINYYNRSFASYVKEYEKRMFSS